MNEFIANIEAAKLHLMQEDILAKGVLQFRALDKPVAAAFHERLDDPCVPPPYIWCHARRLKLLRATRGSWRCVRSLARYRILEIISTNLARVAICGGVDRRSMALPRSRLSH